MKNKELGNLVDYFYIALDSVIYESDEDLLYILEQFEAEFLGFC
jgi:hypothetical protein